MSISWSDDPDHYSGDWDSIRVIKPGDCTKVSQVKSFSWLWTSKPAYVEPMRHRKAYDCAFYDKYDNAATLPNRCGDFRKFEFHVGSFPLELPDSTKVGRQPWNSYDNVGEELGKYKRKRILVKYMMSSARSSVVRENQATLLVQLDNEMTVCHNIYI